MSDLVENAASLLAGLDRGESLPARWYTDPSITERETHRIFRRTWNYIGPLNELQKIGDYITGYVGEIPVVVLRNEAGLAALVNVCRHRRHEVMKGRGNARMMQCGYHAWTYDLTRLPEERAAHGGGAGLPVKRLPAAAVAGRHAGTVGLRQCRPRCRTARQALWRGARHHRRERAQSWTPWSCIRVRPGTATPTGRRCWRTSWSAITALSPIRASAPPSTCGRTSTISACTAGSAAKSARCDRRRWRGRARSRSTTRAARSPRRNTTCCFPT